jgi:signal transduction histidine kinase/ligand-binding sensor domain-containing protein
VTSWVRGLAQDREGTIWAATGTGLLRLEGNRWAGVGTDWSFPGKHANAVFLDAKGTLWVATESTIVFLPAGTRQFQPTGVSVGQVMQFVQAPNGKLWMAETSRSVRPVPLGDKRPPSDDTEIANGSGGILFDRDGALWITTVGDGMRRAPDPESLNGKVKEFSTAIESLTSKDGLSDDEAFAILQDHEGSIWVGTREGLDRFRKTNIVTIASPFPAGAAVLAAGDNGDLWMGSGRTGQLVRMHDGRTDPEGQLPSIRGSYRDPDGAVFWVTLFGIFRSKNQHVSKFPLPEGFASPSARIWLTGDHPGKLWLDEPNHGLFLLQNGSWIKVEGGHEFTALPDSAFTDWLGRAWFGLGGTLVVLNGTKIERVYSPQDSLAGGVNAIHGGYGHVWVGGGSGLALFIGNRFYPVIPDDHTRFNVRGIVESSSGDLWLCESRGILRISSAEVRKVLGNPGSPVKYELFDSSDGLPGAFSETPNLWPIAVQGTDGRIWFATSKGIAWINPSNIRKNTLPPPVVIRAVGADGKQYSSLTNLTLPALTSNIWIRYTGLSLSVPDRVRFRYKLAGVDKDWQDAGTRREAFYNNLRPSSYRFQVIACNNDGVWNEQGAVLTFTILPTWYQTNWFLAACMITGVLVVWTVIQLRMRQLARSLSARFDERLAERTRVARELHDTLLQTVQGSKMVADDALEQPGDPARMQRALQQLSGWLGQAAQEERTALNLLRASTTSQNDLAEAFRRAIEDCRRQDSLEASFSLNGHPKEMHPVVRDEIYRIGYEAIRNACTHSRASRVSVRLAYAQDLTLHVTDNGVGIDPIVLDEGKNGHYGLLGMRERAARIAARLSITSSKDSGTDVKLVVPGRIIFHDRAPMLFQRIAAVFRRKGKV